MISRTRSANVASTSCLLLVIITGLGCVTAPNTGDKSSGAQPGEAKHEEPIAPANANEAIEGYFTDREKLDPIEGGWVWSNNTYEVVIIRNTLGIEPDYQYVGVIIRTGTEQFRTKRDRRRNRRRWKSGDIKLLLRETASSGLYTGVYFMGDKSRRNTSFIMSNPNMIETSVTGPDRTLLIRTYPKEPTHKGAAGDDVAVMGSGFFVGPNGFILTSAHVVEDAEKIAVRLQNGLVLDATVDRLSSATDLALLKVDYLTQDYLSLDFSDNVSIGDDVFTVGFPTTQLLGLDPKYSNGTVSSLSGLKGDATFFQVSVPIQPGNSGGPLVSKKSGRVVGIITSTAAVENFYRATGALPQNVNWAVKAEYAIPLKPSLRPDIGDDEGADIQRARRSVVLIEVTR